MTNIGGKYGNTNSFYGQAVYGDTSAPTLDITSSNFTFDGFINSSPVSFTATFSEPVYNFTAADISITNGTVGNFSGNAGSSVYTFSVTPGSNGGVVVSIPGSDAYDGSGNPIPSDSYSFIYDTQRPSVIIDGYNGSVVNGVAQATTITLQITFSEPVIGFTVSDITISGGSIVEGSFVAASTSAYRFDVYSLGSVLLDVAANVCTDRAGNQNLAAVQFDYVYDIVAPTVTISSASVSSGSFRQSTGPVPLTIAFSESVSGFLVGDISITNGSLSNFSGSGSSYSVDAYASSEGLVSIQVPSSVAADSAGNQNTASNTFTFTYDITRPSVTITADIVSNDGYTNRAPIITIAFSESVTGFTSSDIQLEGGNIAVFSGSGSTYTFTLTSNTEGIKTIFVPENRAQDSAGNLNTASNTFTYTRDITAPTVEITSSTVSLDGYTKTSPILFTATFSEPVEGFNALQDVAAVGGTISNFVVVSSSVYTFNFNPSGQGSKSVRIPENTYYDRAGVLNDDSSVYSFTFDSVRPTVTISSTNGVLASGGFTSSAGPFGFTIEFSEPVSGFLVTDLALSGGTASNFAGSGSTYTFDFTMSGQGSKSISVAEAVAQDSAGNTNTASNTFAFTYDSVRPSVVLGTSSIINDGYTSLASIPFTVVFSESVADFASGDITVSGGSVSGFSGSGTNYSFNFIPSGQGSKSVSIAENVAQDSAGNQNLASDSYSFIFDDTAPTVSFAVKANGLSITNDGYAKDSNIVVEVRFSERVAGLLASEIAATNSVKGILSTEDEVDGYASIFLLPLTPSNDGEITLNLAAEAAYDRAGNLSTAAEEFSFIFDSTRPTITSFTCSEVADDGYANISSASFSISFSEPVTGFSLADVVASAGTKGSLAGEGQNYTFSLTSLPEGLIEVYVIQSAVLDSAGNLNISQSETYSFTVDRTRPTPVISSGTVTAGGIATSRFNSFTVDFGEPVSGFVSGGIQVTNGILTNFVATSEGYSRTFTFDFEATLGAQTSSLGIAQNIATDRAGNNNFAATTFSFTNDIAPPSVVFRSADVTNGGFTTANPVSIVATWSETPVGFSAADITAVSGTIVNFSTTGNSRVFTFDVNPVSNSSMISFFVPAGAVTDAIGNENLVSDTFTAYLIRRTKVGQTDQFLSSLGYDDNLNQASAEMQSGAFIESGVNVVAATTSGFKFSGNIGAFGVNKHDSLIISGNAAYNGTYEILSVTYSSQNNETVIVVDDTLVANPALSGTTASFKIDDSKSLERDLNHIRSQLKILSNLDGSWYDTPVNKPVYVYRTSTTATKEAGVAIDVGFNFDAGDPFDLSVYLNGQLLTPSIVSGGAILTQNDYQECDSQGNLVNPGQIGRTIKINFALYLGDILQMIWNK